MDQIDKQQSVNILMVEDRKSYYELFRKTILEEWPNANIPIASSGQEALDLFAASEPKEWHLIILDLGLPDCRGEDLLATFRSMAKLRATPILILTGTDDEETQSRLLSNGANDFVAKGSSPALFMARLRVQLQQKLTVDHLTQKALNMEMFTTGVLHDIRNIETNIITLCDLMERNLKHDPVQHRTTLLQDISALRSQTKRINDYASSILKKVRASHHPFSPTTIHIPDVVQWAAHLMAQYEDLEWYCHKPFVDLHCDAAMIKLAFLNICQNSYKFKRPEEKCSIHIYQEPCTPDAAFVTTYIEDNGIGLSDEKDYKRIFFPFNKAKGQSKKDGFGLGLALVAKVTSSMQGDVWAEPAGKYTSSGLRIALRLPVAGDSSAKPQNDD